MSRLKNLLYSTILLFFLTVAFSGCSSPPEGNAADGKRWYRMHNCHACHGEKGNDGRGPDIAGLDMSYGGFVDRLRNARTQVMPEYSKEKIDDQMAADILAYLRNQE